MAQAMLNILHVEDDISDACLIKEMLNRTEGFTRPYNLVQVDSLKDALNAMQHYGFNAVLLDLNLRDHSGIENIRVISEENPDMPIVVITGMDNEDMALRAVKSGAQEYIVKGHGDGHIIHMAIKSSIERKAHERNLFQQANFDELTGLPNRRMFMQQMEKTMQKAKRWGMKESILFLDLNKFKEINDSLGHEAGNQVIKQVATRLNGTLRASDTVARYGGDEFIIHLDNPGLNHKQASSTVAIKLLTCLEHPFQIMGKDFSISASIGIAIYPECGHTLEELVHNADKAMYIAKHIGPNRYVFAT